MNRSLLTLALCMALAPVAVGCDGEAPEIDEEEQGEASDEASDEEIEDADPTDSDIDECEDGETGYCADGAPRGCIEAEANHWVWHACEEEEEDDMGESSSSTPLVLSFDGAEATIVAGASSAFDLSGTGAAPATDWPAARTPWLAIDRDGDGRIADARELFGSAVTLGSGTQARHGFEALAELDENRDGVVDAADPRFAELLVWADENADRASSATELTSAAQRGLISVELGSVSRASCDARGNCGVERARFTFRADDGSVRAGEVIDIHLAHH
jgi:hypothetical protein